MQSFTTSGPYRRNPAHDRRNARHDEFAGDAWEEPGGIRFYVAVGHVPTAPRTFTQCGRCWGEGKTGMWLADSLVPDVPCKQCGGTGWICAAAPA
jgi:hypothetical protein